MTYSLPKGVYVILLGGILLSIIAFNLDTRPRNTVELVEQVKPGTVLITNQIDATSGGSGSGFILEDNMIITNHHVIDGNGKISVYSPNSRKKYEAKVVYQDKIVDLAILRLLDWELFEKEQKPVNLKLGNSDETTEGDKIVVIGNPWGLTWSVSEGILSAKNRRSGPNPKYLDQVDAKVYQGNSGGPIFNENGQVVCVSEIMLSGEGGSYGFCIPSNLVKKVIHDFNVLGEVRWRVLNVAVGLTDDGSNVILQSVEPDGAAGKAGLKEGDKILTIFTEDNRTGKKIVTPDDMITELATLHGDDEDVRISIDRNGEKMMIDVKTNYKLSSEYTPDKAR